MNIEVFIHADSRGPRATVKAWWVDGGGVHHAELMSCHALTHSADEMNPWSLLSALWFELRDVKAQQEAPSGHQPDGASTT